jgi:hypothetical protein
MAVPLTLEEIKSTTKPGSPERNRLLAELARQQGVYEDPAGMAWSPAIVSEAAPVEEPVYQTAPPITEEQKRGIYRGPRGGAWEPALVPKTAPVPTPKEQTAMEWIQQQPASTELDPYAAPIDLTEGGYERELAQKKEGAFVPIQPMGQLAGPQLPRMPGIPGTGKMSQLERQYGEQAKALQEKIEDLGEAGLQVFEKQKDVAHKHRIEAQLTASKEAELSKARTAEMAKIQQDEKAMYDRQAQLYQGEQDKLNMSLAELRSMKVDPSRIFKRPDGSNDYGKRVIAAVAVALGALGSAMPRRFGGTGGPNTALQIVTGAIDRDMQAQIQDIATKKAGIGVQMNLMSLMRQKFGDERQAQAAFKINALEVYKQKIAETAARSKFRQVQINADREIANIDAAQLQYKTAFDKAAAETALQTTQAQFGMAERTLGRRLQTTQMKMAQAAALAKSATHVGAGQAPIGLRQIGPTDKEFTKDAVKYKGDFNKVMGNLNDLINWRQTFGMETLNRAALKRAKVIAGRAIINMKKTDEMGAHFTEMEKELLNIPEDPGEAGFVLDGLQEVLKQVMQEANGFLEPRGYELSTTPMQSQKLVE